MTRYRKKPVVIEAVSVSEVLRAAEHAWPNLPPWLVEGYEGGYVLFLNGRVLIRTLEGDMRGDPGDWIIRGVKGELYPCRNDIFEATYEPVEEPTR